jgi:hypothetical protein
MTQPDNIGFTYIDLTHIGHAIERLTTEVASLRDEIGVLTAIVIRLDPTPIPSSPPPDRSC